MPYKSSQLPDIHGIDVLNYRPGHNVEYYLGDPLAPTNVATPKYQIWVSLFPGGNFLAKFSYKFLHRWSCTQTAQIALEYYSHTMGVWKSIY